jgi:hypothetical protein
MVDRFSLGIPRPARHDFNVNTFIHASAKGTQTLPNNDRSFELDGIIEV